MSQKADDYVKAVNAVKSGVLGVNWSVLDTERIELLSQVLFQSTVVEDSFTQDDLDSAKMKAVLQASEYFEKRGSNGVLNETYFIRACPLVARPGVLESSAAGTYNKAMEIVTRIIDTMFSKDTSAEPMYEHGYVDPFGSIMIQKFVRADASAVVQPTSNIRMGDNHDGVTAGTSDLIVTLPHVHDYNSEESFLTLGTNPKMTEVEFVTQRTGESDIMDAVRKSHMVQHLPYMVQLRGKTVEHEPLSPPPEGVTIQGRIPTGREEVLHIHIVEDGSDTELARMEEMLRCNPPKGTFVYHMGSGASLNSHHAGQCGKYEVPYFMTPLNVGETWQEVAAGWVTTDLTLEPKPYDPFPFVDSFTDGIEVGLYDYARQYGWLSNHFHQFASAPLSDLRNTAFFGGVFVGWLINSGMSIGTGELRHSRSQRNQKHDLLVPVVLQALYNDHWTDVHNTRVMSSNRKHYYYNIEQQPITIDSIIMQLKWLSKQFHGGWSGGYGGAKYKQSIDATIKLTQVVKKLLNNPTKQNLLDTIGEANTCENNQHNTGFFFNKFISKQALDWGTDPTQITLNPVLFFQVYYAAKAAHESVPDMDEVKDVTHIFKYIKKQTLTGLRNHPLYTRNDLPEEIAEQEETILNHAYNHFHTGKYGDSSNIQLFIPCGSKHCDTCKSMYTDKIKASIIPTIPMKVNESFDKPDVYFPDKTTTESSVDEEYSMLIHARVLVYKENFKTHTNTQDEMGVIPSFYKWAEGVDVNMLTDYHYNKFIQLFARMNSFTHALLDAMPQDMQKEFHSKLMKNGEDDNGQEEE
jgi:hypothetical protein